MCKKEKRYRLADFFELNWDEYVKNPKEFIRPEQFKAVNALRSCRTEALGIDHYICDHCGEASRLYHNCKNRFCPTCSWKDTLEWADKMKDQMMDIPHRHVVFTLPHKLNELVKDNKAKLLNILFQCAADSIKDWMYHKHRTLPGIISVLHTFGEKKDLHPHIHMILSWGGITDDKQLKLIKGEFINYKFIQTKFRCKFEDKLIHLFDNDNLQHNFKNRIEFMKFIKKTNLKHWRINFEPAMKIPEQVIRYIGRYSKRACISEYKITDIQGELISFNYKDYKNLDIYGKPIVKELTLNFREFFPRLLQHVPIPYFRLVRYYGVYAPRAKAMLQQIIPKQVHNTDKDRQESKTYDLTEKIKTCNNCKNPKVYLYTTFINKNGQRVYMSRINTNRKNKFKNVAA